MIKFVLSYVMTGNYDLIFHCIGKILNIGLMHHQTNILVLHNRLLAFKNDFNCIINCSSFAVFSSSYPPVDFDTMTRGPNKVRRLSTINSLLEPTFILTTEWVWYWEDEYGKWNAYASAVSNRSQSCFRRDNAMVAQF